MKTFKPYTPDQLLLLPPALQDWLPEGHLALFLSDMFSDCPPAFGPAYRARSDYNGDGMVTILDLASFLRVYFASGSLISR